MNWAISRVPNSQAWFVGVLVRDNSSSVLAAMRHPRIGACIQVLQFVLDMGFFYIELEGLEIAILKNAHSLSLGVSVEDMWLEEICNLIFQFHHFTVSLASSSSNWAALALVQYGASHQLQHVWLEQVPTAIQGVL